MSRESHRRFLEKSASRTLRRKLARESHQSLRREDAARLRIQTVEPWKRILCLLVGGGFLFLSWMIQRADGNRWAVLVLGALGAAALLLGLLGRKRPIDAVLDATADALVSRIFDAF